MDESPRAVALSELANALQRAMLLIAELQQALESARRAVVTLTKE